MHYRRIISNLHPPPYHNFLLSPLLTLFYLCGFWPIYGTPISHTSTILRPSLLHISLAPPHWDLPQLLLLKMVSTNFFPLLALYLSLPCSIFLHSLHYPLTQCIFSLFTLVNVCPLQLECNSKTVGIIDCFGYCCVLEPTYNLAHIVSAQQIIV